MFRPKAWLPGVFSKPKNPHSLDHLKYLYTVLCKNQTVTENNRGLLVETLRSISEILIWGDQNDSSVFDFFLEKNMLSFFIRYLRQKSGRYICVQLLQTLNILFENISNETSLYYLLSNNHVNSIIIHKFDFSDEEVMAYYISFLKTLSLKLNKHTIHFFYNEHTNDFALYTEAIKFFNHSESMVRIAVRTITLNVYKVDDKAMLRYIRDKTAAPYFSNLVWFIGNHILDLDMCVRNDADHQSRDRLADLVAEHLDHLHYLNDILCIGIDTLNEVLTDQFLNRLLIPLYVYSLTKRKKYSSQQEGDKKHVSSVVALFLLSQVFLILSHAPLVRQLAEIIFNGDISLTRQDTREMSPRTRVREFAAPKESLAKTLEKRGEMGNQEGKSTFYMQTDPSEDMSSPSTEEALSPSSPGFSTAGETDMSSPNQNSTDEEKLLGILHREHVSAEQRQAEFSFTNRPYLEAIFNSLECRENDYETLFSLCLLYAMGHNEGIHQGLLDTVLMPTDRSETKDHYNVILVEKLIRIITLACQQTSKVRLATLELSIKLLKQLVYKRGKSYLKDQHLACVENAREGSTQLLRNFYKSEEIFLDMFEDEYRELQTRPLNVEYLMMDASILLPPAGTPLTGIDFNKRLPCGEVERARRAIRVFFLLRDLSLTLLQEVEVQLPLTLDENCVKISDVLDLNNSDLIACTVLTRESRKQERRFLVIDTQQLILVEPDTKRLGWGLVRFVGFLQDVEVSGDKDDSRSLHVTIHKPAKSAHARPIPLLAAKFIFDDHIRCMAAKQRLVKGRLKARQQKMQMIERLLDIPLEQSSSMGLYNYGARGAAGAVPGQVHRVKRPQVTHAQEKTDVKSPRGGSGLPIPPAKQRSSSQLQPGKASSPTSVPKTRYQARPEDMEDVEEAVDATSPSAFAFQTLNPQSNPNSPQRKQSRSSATSDNNLQEIPLEDLSKRTPRRRLSGIEKVGHTILSSSIHAIRGRSQSHSPRRGRSGSGVTGIPVLERPASGKERSRSLTVDPSHDRGTPVWKPSQPKPSLKGYLSSSPTHSGNSSPRSSDSSTASPPSLGAQSPKTLRPAKAPPTTLLPQGQEKDIGSVGAIDSPKLVPPADTGRVRSLSEGSSTGGGSDPGLEPHTIASLTIDFTQPETEAAKATVTLAKTGQAGHQPSAGQTGQRSTSDQLTKLAQMVQEHYNFMDDDRQQSPVREKDKAHKVMDI